MDGAMNVDSLRLADPLTQMFCRHPIYDNILSRLSPLQLTRIAFVNGFIRDAAADFSIRAYNVNRRLSRFFNDLLSFRSLMTRTQMVICGSFALQLFDRTYYPDSDLDLYVHPNDSLIEVGEYLQKGGYTYVPREWHCPVFTEEAQSALTTIKKWVQHEVASDMLYSINSVRAVYTFERRIAPDDVRKVQIILPRLSPVACILDFHSTCVMNIVTYNAAYSLYPYATFGRRESLVVNQQCQSDAALAKYSTRGWRILANPSPINEHMARAEPGSPFHAPWFAIGAQRWVDDRLSWVIQLDTTGVAPPPPLSPSSPHPGWDPVAQCGWKLQMAKDPEFKEADLIVTYAEIRTTVFRWQYIVPDSEFLEEVMPFLRDQGILEHKKVPSGGSWTSAGEAWTWWDFRLPMLREQYLAERGEEEKTRRSVEYRK